MATGTDITNYCHPMSLNFSYFISHYQFGKTNQYEKAKIELMGYLCADLAFDFLRTKSTLGYLCFSKVIKVSDYYGFRHGFKNNKSYPVHVTFSILRYSLVVLIHVMR